MRPHGDFNNAKFSRTLIPSCSLHIFERYLLAQDEAGTVFRCLPLIWLTRLVFPATSFRCVDVGEPYRHDILVFDDLDGVSVRYACNPVSGAEGGGGDRRATMRTTVNRRALISPSLMGYVRSWRWI